MSTGRPRSPARPEPLASNLTSMSRGSARTPSSPSPYIASKGRGEAVTLDAFPDATILRPSVVFGPEDDFFNRFGALSRFLPVIPLFAGGATRLQPVYVGDVARAAAAALAGSAKPGAAYELGGPGVMTLREAAELVLRTVERRRLLVGLPVGPFAPDRLRRARLRAARRLAFIRSCSRPAATRSTSLPPTMSCRPRRKPLAGPFAGSASSPRRPMRSFKPTLCVSGRQASMRPSVRPEGGALRDAVAIVVMMVSY